MADRASAFRKWAWIPIAASMALGLWLWRDRVSEPAPGPPADLPGGWAEGIDGAWGLAREADPRLAQPIEGIGYAGGFEEGEGLQGVTIHDPAKAEAGWNLYCSGHGPEALLMDMDGKVVHRWRRSWRDVPGAPPLDHRGQDTFRRVALLEGGHLLAVFGGRGLVRLDAKSEVVWSYTERAHHDLEVLDDGSIWTLIRAERSVPEINTAAPIVDDYAVRLSADGQELERHSVVDALLQSTWSRLLPPGRGLAGDILHTNSIRRLDGSLRSGNPAFTAGNLLLCVRELDLVCVLDPRNGAITWGTGGPWRGPHDPTVTPDGTLLLFDNMGLGGHSQAIEFDMESGDIRWNYRGSPPAAFSSLFCGAARRLPGGNTLLSESTRGRAIEVTREGEIVWEFHNPERAGARSELVAAIFELRRLPLDTKLDWL